MPQGLDEFYPKPGQLTGAEKVGKILDLGRPEWLSVAESEAFNAEHLSAETLEPANDQQLTALREVISDWAARELSVRVDPVKEVFIGGGTSDNLHLAALAYLDPGDLAIYPNPGYPTYRQAILSHGAEPLGYQLTEKHGFKPRLKHFSERVGRAARLLFLNNPHNPSGAELDIEELDELLWLAARDNLLVLSDAAYYAYRTGEGVSILHSASGRRVGLEFYSFSYLLGVPKAPFGFAIGAKDLIAGLEAAAKVRPPMMMSRWVTRATGALAQYPGATTMNSRARIRESWRPAHELCEALKAEPVSREGFPYLLARIKRRTASQTFANSALRRWGIVTLPAVAFGDLGEGYLRLSLTRGPLPFQEALQRHKSSKRNQKSA